MNKRDDLWIEIKKLFPNVDPDELRWSVDFALKKYHARREISRDTAPTLPQVRIWLKDIQKNLDAIAKTLMKDEGSIFNLGLSRELDESSDDGALFASTVHDLLKATNRKITEVDRGSYIAFNGVPHTRRTRAETRDTFLIPALTKIAMRARLQPSSDWEDLDQTCDFVKLVLEHAEIDSPDTGKDVERRGEKAQGRLRRAVKEAARSLTNSGHKPPR